ncbi:hypothetical protein G6F66_015666 [Rhizopus arrhizus]|nr:hypothetical protein G6F66_015666 [Rhizopus arrhizus]
MGSVWPIQSPYFATSLESSRNRLVPIQRTCSNSGIGASQDAMRAIVPTGARVSTPSGDRTSLPAKRPTTPNSLPSAIQRRIISR